MTDDRVKRLEDALCMAICIIMNCEGLNRIQGNNSGTLAKFANELVEESGMDFDAVLMRIFDEEETKCQNS